MAHSPSEFFERIEAIANSLDTFNPSAVILGALSLAIIVLLPRWLSKVPGSIVALLAGTSAVALFHLPVATIGTTFGGILRLEAADIAVWMITFALTVMADLTIAVEAGLALAALLYIYRVTETTSVSVATPDYIAAGQVHSLQGKDVPPYVTILRIHGPFLFGTTDKLNDVAAGIDSFNPIVILRLRNMTAIDATGLHALERFSDQLRISGRTLLVCGARHQPATFLEKAEFVEQIGRDNIVPHVEAALARARALAPRLHG